MNVAQHLQSHVGPFVPRGMEGDSVDASLVVDHSLLDDGLPIKPRFQRGRADLKQIPLHRMIHAKANPALVVPGSSRTIVPPALSLRSASPFFFLSTPCHCFSFWLILIFWIKRDW